MSTKKKILTMFAVIAGGMAAGGSTDRIKEENIC